jgi:hypothetical protein
MNQYLFQQEPSSPPQHILLDQFLPRSVKPTTRFSEAKTPEQVAAIIANDMLESIKDTFTSVGNRHLLEK